MSDSLLLHGLQHTMLPCPSLSPRVCSNSCPLSQWCYLSILSSATPFSFCLQYFLASGYFPMSQHQVAKVLELQLKHQSFQWIFGLISFSIDWFDLLAVQGNLQSPPVPQFKSINSLVLILIYSPALTSVHDYWKNHNFDYMDLCNQSDLCLLICCLGLSWLFPPRSKCLLISSLYLLHFRHYSN